MLALRGFLTSGATPSTYDSLLTTEDDPPKEMDVFLEAVAGRAANGHKARHLKGMDQSRISKQSSVVDRICESLVSVIR